MSGFRHRVETLKIRDVLQDPDGVNTCLQDIINAFVEASAPGSELEYTNSPTMLRNYRSKLQVARLKIKEHDEYLKEIETDIYVKRDAGTMSEDLRTKIDDYNKKRSEESKRKKILAAQKLLREEGLIK